MYEYFFIFFMLLIASSVLLNGWFAITRGWWQSYPDGTRQKKGKILRGWYFYWYQEHLMPKRYYYKGGKLETLARRFAMYTTGRYQLRKEEGLYVDDVFFADIAVLQEELGIKFLIISSSTQPSMVDKDNKYRHSVAPYEEEPNYVFPWWVRYPLAGCITCFSSVYGTIVFALIHLLFGKQLLIDFYWSVQLPIWSAMLLTWVVYTISLAWLTTVLWKWMPKN